MIKLELCPFCGGTAKPRVNLANAQPVMRCRCCGSWTYFDETEKIKDGEKAAEAMIKAWNKRANGWIKTSEGLPEIGEAVQVYSPEEKKQKILMMALKKTSWREMPLIWVDPQHPGITRIYERVTHWAPLPGLPKEVE